MRNTSMMSANFARTCHALGAEKTIIIVAHRLTTLKDCDVIYRVTDGGVEEETAWKKN